LATRRWRSRGERKPRDTPGAEGGRCAARAGAVWAVGGVPAARLHAPASPRLDARGGARQAPQGLSAAPESAFVSLRAPRRPQGGLLGELRAMGISDSDKEGSVWLGLPLRRTVRSQIRTFFSLRCGQIESRIAPRHGFSSHRYVAGVPHWARKCCANRRFDEPSSDSRRRAADCLWRPRPRRSSFSLVLAAGFRSFSRAQSPLLLTEDSTKGDFLVLMSHTYDDQASYTTPPRLVSSWENSILVQNLSPRFC
jgi:hypothetical protein